MSIKRKHGVQAAVILQEQVFFVHASQFILMNNYHFKRTSIKTLNFHTIIPYTDYIIGYVIITQRSRRVAIEDVMKNLPLTSFPSINVRQTLSQIQGQCYSHSKGLHLVFNGTCACILAGEYASKQCGNPPPLSQTFVVLTSQRT